MAKEFEKTKIESLVQFTDIKPIYSIGDDIECQFGIDSSLEPTLGFVGLYKVGRNRVKDWLVREVNLTETPEPINGFVEKEWKLKALYLNRFSNDMNQFYQFCYVYPFDGTGNRFCGTSQCFQFVHSIPKPEKQIFLKTSQLIEMFESLDEINCKIDTNLLLNSYNKPKRQPLNAIENCDSIANPICELCELTTDLNSEHNCIQSLKLVNEIIYGEVERLRKLMTKVKQNSHILNMFSVIDSARNHINNYEVLKQSNELSEDLIKYLISKSIESINSKNSFGEIANFLRESVNRPNSLSEVLWNVCVFIDEITETMFVSNYCLSIRFDKLVIKMFSL